MSWPLTTTSVTRRLACQHPWDDLGGQISEIPGGWGKPYILNRSRPNSIAQPELWAWNMPELASPALPVHTPFDADMGLYAQKHNQAPVTFPALPSRQIYY